MNVYSKVYKETDEFKTNEFMMQINEAYQTKYDYKGNKLFDDFDLIIVRINVRKLYGKKTPLNTGRFILNANGNNYYHVIEYNDELKDLGNTIFVSYLSSKEALNNSSIPILFLFLNPA